jgi:hypothetical protein
MPGNDIIVSTKYYHLADYFNWLTLKQAHEVTMCVNPNMGRQ